MPAGSEAAPQLPRTWRPFGIRIAVGVLGAMLFVLVVLVWIGLDESVRRQFTGFQRGTLVFLGLLLLATYNALWRSRVTATADRLTVVNGYRTHRYEWSQVIGVSMRRGAPWATADLSDGTTVSLFAVQGSDGARARRAIREIRATVADRTPEL
jgi:hypothetical protein